MILALAVGLTGVWGCRSSEERGTPLGDQTQTDILTTLSAVQSWAAILLEDIVDTDLMQRETVLGSDDELTSIEKARLANARLLVAYDGQIDAQVVEDFREYHAKADEAILYVAPNRTDSNFDWLEPIKAKVQVATLAKALISEGIVDEDSGLDARVRDLDARFDALEKSILSTLTDFSGQRVLVDDIRLKPWLEHYGLQVAGVLTFDAKDAPAQEDLDRFERIIGTLENPVCVITSPVSKAYLSERASDWNLRMVSFDTLQTGFVGRDHYFQQLEHNVFLLTFVLNGNQPSTTEPGARFIPEWGE